MSEITGLLDIVSSTSRRHCGTSKFSPTKVRAKLNHNLSPENHEHKRATRFTPYFIYVLTSKDNGMWLLPSRLVCDFKGFRIELLNQKARV